MAQEYIDCANFNEACLPEIEHAMRFEDECDFPFNADAAEYTYCWDDYVDD